MYAVIRAGGKQYRVAPGDVIRVETLAGATDGKINFGDVLAISGEQGQIARAQADAHVTGGNFSQLNGRAVQVAGVSSVRFEAGTDSQGRPLAAQTNQAQFEQDGQVVTQQVVSGP